MTEKKCYIVGAGDFCRERFNPVPGDFLIAADGGYLFLKEMDICPDMIVGDFDSLGFVPEHDCVVKHPVMKDDTDLALAAEQAIENGYNKLHFFGVTGGRLDHTIAAMQLLIGISKQGVQGYLYGGDFTVTALASEKAGECKELWFPEGYEGTISVFSFSESAKGVSEKGLLYGLEEAELTSATALGVSNSFTGETASISVREGSLVIMWYGNEQRPLPLVRKTKVTE